MMVADLCLSGVVAEKLRVLVAVFATVWYGG